MAAFATAPRTMDRFARRTAHLAWPAPSALPHAGLAWTPGKALPALLLAAVALGAAGCRDIGRDRHQAAIELSERVRRALAADGIAVDGAVACIQPLPSRIGAATQCATGLPGDHARLYDVQVRSIGAAGPTLQVRPARLTVARASVEARAVELLARHPNAQPIRSAQCPADLSGLPGQSLRCRAVLPDGRRNDFTATLEGVSGGFVTALFTKYTIAQDVSPERLAASLDGLLRANRELPPSQLKGARVDCSGALQAMAGASARCTLSGPRLLPTEIAVRYRGIDAKTQQIMMEYESIDPERARK